MYDVHLGLIGKRVVDFLLVLIELFRCVTAESLRAKKSSKIATTNYSFSQKTRLNDLSYGIKIWTYLSSILSQITRLSDGQTDRQTDIRQTDRQNYHRLTASALHAALKNVFLALFFTHFKLLL